MKIVGPVGLLVLSFDAPSRSSHVRIAPDLQQVLGVWRPSTRVSPLFGLVEEGQEPEAWTSHFDGQYYAVLIGPVNPAGLPALRTGVRVWVTLGVLNILILAQTLEDLRPAVDWALTNGVAVERWGITDGALTDVDFTEARNPGVEQELQAIARLSAKPVPPDMQPALSEYCALMASALARSAATVPAVIADLVAVHRFVETVLRATDLDAHPVLYKTVGILSQLNGGVSRFSSQALSGVSPVASTECHFWIHSLLGTGVANLALHRIANFVSRKLESKRISSRAGALASRTEKVPDLRLVDVDFWHGNHLETIEPADGEEDGETVPLLTHFSGRDGFRSGLNTVSAPLVSIAACNCRQWSLSTVTHEISHVLVRGALAVLFPNPATAAGLGIVRDFVANRAPHTWLRSVQFYLIETAVAMQQTAERAAEKAPTTKWTEQRIGALLDVWHHEIEEIMVHVFDFLYFHGQQSDRYVRSIWTTWGVIPTIGNRIEEYLIRTLCTIYVRHLRRREAMDVTREEVGVALRALSDAGVGPHVTSALALLTDEARWPRLQSTLLARLGLVQLVRGFLYWDAAAQNVRGDTALTTDASDRGGYAFRVREIAAEEIDNPLRFVEEYTDSSVPSPATSAWMLYALAFWVKDDAHAV